MRDRVGEGRSIAGGDQNRVLTVGQHLGHDAYAGGDQRPAGGEALEDDARHSVGFERDVQDEVERREHLG